MNLPDKKYNIIVADPPWEIDKVKLKIRPNQVKMDYTMMTLDEIKALPVQDIAAQKCMLFLWTIDKYLYKAPEVLKAWGFKYHLTMAWDKMNGIPLYGFQRQTEFVLVGLKGKHDFMVKRQLIHTSFSAPSHRHSEKPEVFYDMLAVLEGERINLFARKRRFDWDAWGDEV